MPGMGTIINVVAIIAGGLIGMTFGKIIPKRVQDALITVCGVSTIILGIGGALEKTFSAGEGGVIVSNGSMMMMLSLIIGTIVGEFINIEKYLERFGVWLKAKTGSSKDAMFVNGFVTASLTVCIGAMAIVGSIEDGINGNYSILMAKAVLDFVIIIAMAASMGKGAMFSFVSVGVFQGVVTALSRVIAPVMTDAAMNNLSLVGNVLIFCVGVNLLFDKKIRVANMLPALVVAVVWTYLPL